MCTASCTSVVRYSDDLVTEQGGRTWFTRVPAGIGGTTGFLVGVPIDICAIPVAWVVYRSLPKETREVPSVFLFPSFVLWQVGAWLGAPFDGAEWLLWRAWQPDRVVSQREREDIEREWDSRLFYSEYPVRPLWPPPSLDGTVLPPLVRPPVAAPDARTDGN
jgi:hypothetical protein